MTVVPVPVPVLVPVVSARDDSTRDDSGDWQWCS
jgi:hypothetical protein